MIGRDVARIAVALFGAALPSIALAHGEVTHGGAASPTWARWEFSPVVVLPILVAAGWYLLGLVRLWSRAGLARGISRRQASLYGAGIAVLVIALLSPLDALSAASFWIHMTQHLLLILVAPPLLVLGAADVAYLWALPPRWRHGFGRFENGVGNWLGGGPNGFRNRLIVVALATGALWLWHFPTLYDLAVRNEALHVAEHVAFVVTALLFWASVLRLRPMDHADNGLRIVSVFAMALQGSILGALITFASRPLYASHQGQPTPLGLDPLIDQQIAGLLMWVPPGLLYIGVACYLFVRWLQALDARNEARDRAVVLARRR